MYAANEPGVLNASVEFDEKTLQPTYRLLVGLAGSSSGLEIARRFGIPAEIIDNANQQVKESSRDAIEYFRRIKREAEDAEACGTRWKKNERPRRKSSRRSIRIFRSVSVRARRSSRDF